MSETKSMSRKAILKKFFGYKPGETLKDFVKELEALSDAETSELATLAAVELGVEVA